MLTNYDYLKDFFPGFVMGISRSCISHPFELLKISSQLGIKNTHFFKGISYSIISTAFERSIQFGFYEKFRKNDNNIVSSMKSSLLSTSITLPYNIILLKKVFMDNSININRTIFSKALILEYNRNLFGSITFLYTYNFLSENNVPIIIRAPLSSWVVWGLTYPLDSYKNKLIYNKNLLLSDLKFNELYRGIKYPLLRSIPSSIVGFYVFEFVKNSL